MYSRSSVLIAAISFTLAHGNLSAISSPQDGIPDWIRDAKLWTDPGPAGRRDLAAGPGGSQLAPRPPFTFLEEIGSGTSIKVKVRDSNGRKWVAKWGTEVKAENFVNRLVWGVGYYVIPVYFVKQGKIEGFTKLKRSSSGYVQSDGSFEEARFQLWDEHLMRGHNWTWGYNPFIGTRELNGLKVLVMLTSNWDNKDAHDVRTGSNNAIQEFRLPDGRKQYRYLIFDWGGSLGKLGLPGIRDKWNCKCFAEQSQGFVHGVRNGYVEWGYTGTHNEVKQAITVGDVKWLLHYLGGLTDEQLRSALEASGATPEEQHCFVNALRDRINQLKQVAAKTEL